MENSIDKLVDVAGPALTGALVTGVGRTHAALAELLRKKNGFFAFEAALRVFPGGESVSSPSLDAWNSPELWRHSYGALTNGMLFFAEDIFGTQFCIKDGTIYTFDPETAELTFLAEDFEGWAEAILADYDLYTGYSIAHEWQVRNGKLSELDRLIPKIPFVLGGEFSVENLISMDGARTMRCRGNLARQIKELPDGAQIRFELID